MAERLISCDDHMDLSQLPADLWTSRLPASLLDRAPHVEERDGQAVWVCDGKAWGRWDGKPPVTGSARPVKALYNAFDRAAIYDQSARRPANPELRLADMDRDGVETQVIFGPIFQISTDDPALRSACYRVYNDWLLDFCKAAPDRLIGLPMLPETPEAAVAELERLIAKGGVRQVNLMIANVNPKLLYTRLVPPAALAPDFLARMGRWRCGSGTFRMNVALSELPSFTALPGREPADHHTSGIILAPSLAYMDRAYDDARAYGWSREPIIEMLIPSTLDDSLAPAGAHVASLFCQHVAPDLPDGASWDERRDEVAGRMIDTVERYAPGFRASVVGRQALSPLDLEREFGLLGGDIFHGALSLDQLFSARPMLGHADYRGPIEGLYHCGSGAHPGGGVTGAPGHNAARAVLADRRAWSRRRH